MCDSLVWFLLTDLI